MLGVFNKQYVNYFTNKLIRFIDPIVVSIDTLPVPRNSVVYWFIPSSVPVPFTSKSISLVGANKVFVTPVLKYWSTAPIGKPMLTSETISNIRVKLKDDAKGTNLIYPTTTHTIAQDDIVVYDMGLFPYMYKNRNDYMYPYQRWYNAIDTLIETVASSTYAREHYIIYELPSVLPLFTTLEQYVGITEPTTTMLKLFNGYKYLNLLELWKLMSPKVSKKDAAKVEINTKLGNLIPKADKINLILVVDKKAVIIKLSDMIAAIKEYGKEHSKITQLAAYNFRKLIMVLLITVSKTNPATADVIDSLVATTTTDNIGLHIKKLADKSNDSSGTKSHSLDADAIITANTQDQDIKQYDISEDDIEKIFSDTVGDDEKDVIELADVMIGRQEAAYAANTVHLTKHIQTIEDIYRDQQSHADRLASEVEFLQSVGMITKSEASKSVAVLKARENMPAPYEELHGNMKDILDTSNDDYSIPSDVVAINDTAPTVFSKEYLVNRVKATNSTYLTKYYRKDIVRSVMHAFDAGDCIVHDYNVTVKEDILGKTEVHTVIVKPLGSKQTKIEFEIPYMKDDGTYTISGNTYTIIPQRADLPIRKVGPTQVALSSYYGSKLFINKCKKKADDLGWYISKQLTAKVDKHPGFSNLISIPSGNKGAKLPKAYELISRYTKAFTYNNMMLSFVYSQRMDYLKLDDKQLSAIESEGRYVLAGIDGDKAPIVFSQQDSMLYRYVNNEYTLIGDIFTLLGINILNGPAEYTTIKIFRQDIPTALLASYYIGLENLLNILKVDYSVHDVNERIRPSQDQYMFTFADAKLVVTRDYGLGDMTLIGLLEYKDEISQLPVEYFSNRNNFTIVFDTIGLPVLYVNEIGLLENMFVDPITAGVLKDMGEPETFKGLLLRANEMLLDDSFTNPTSIQGMRIRTHERVAGMICSTITGSIRDHRNRSIFSKSVPSVPRRQIMDLLTSDSTSMPKADMNPLEEIHQTHTVTFLGEGGRSVTGMVKDTRVYSSTEVGVIAPESRDSGKVAITATLSHATNITNLRGKVRMYDDKKDGWSNLISTAMIGAPWVKHDDGKRGNFVSIQNKHVNPIPNPELPYARTPIDTLVAIMAGNKFAINASGEGKITKVTSKEVHVEYINGSNVKYKLIDWTSHEEGGTCYLHKMKTIRREGEIIAKDDNLIYDSGFFVPDIFNNKRVVFCPGANIYVARSEEFNTLEDSGVLFKHLKNFYSVSQCKAFSIVVTNKMDVWDIVKPGTKVTPNDQLLVKANSTGIKADSRISDVALDILKDMHQSAPKAKINGTVVKIEVKYNCELDTMTPSLKAIADTSDKELLSKYGYKGRVDGRYSINGVPLPTDHVEIKIYIETTEAANVGSKYILCNQLKFTLGNISSDKIYSGVTNELVGLVFSTTSIGNRIVLSPELYGTTAECMKILTKKAIAAYFE